MPVILTPRDLAWISVLGAVVLRLQGCESHMSSKGEAEKGSTAGVGSPGHWQTVASMPDKSPT